MKCVVEGCKALSRGNGVGKNGEYCLRHGGRSICISKTSETQCPGHCNSKVGKNKFV